MEIITDPPHLALFVHHKKTIRSDRWSSQPAVEFAAVSWILMVIIGIEFLLRFGIYVMNSGKIPTEANRFGLNIPSRLIERFSNLFINLTGESIWAKRFV